MPQKTPSIQDIVNAVLAPRGTRGRVGATVADSMPVPSNLLLARLIVASGGDYSESEIRWAAEQVGVIDVDAFLVELESWL